MVSETLNVKKTIEADTEELFLAMMAGVQALGLACDVVMRWRGGMPCWKVTIYVPEAERDEATE